MRSAFVALCLIASPALMAAPSCAVPGKLMHWQLSYCMSKYETDDIGDERVQNCYSREEKKTFASTCEGKQSYKQQMCKLMHDTATAQNKCANNPKFIPEAVANNGA